jgi:hypothetical protein
MPTPPLAADAARPSAADVNAQIRRLSAGRTVWTREALAELARLQAAWREAVAREAALAA